jgi:hypothetical protein
MESLGVLGIIHDLTNVEKLHVYGMHVHILTLVLLQTEIRLPEGRLEHIVSVVFHGIFGNHL